MSERRIGDESPTEITRAMAKTYNACTGAPATLKPGCVLSMAEALEDMLTMYTDLINSGDCGNWNPEHDEEVIIARAALAMYNGGE